MDLKQVSVWRNRAGKAGTVFCLLLFMAILDALIARFREQPNHFSTLPNEEIAVTSPLADQTGTLADLIYTSSARGITLRFENLQKGYWLGGDMWNGTIKIDMTVTPGSYTVSVQNRKGTQNNRGPLFYIDVYNTSANLRSHSLSFLIRLFGITPWWAVLFFMPWVLLSFGTVFYLSGVRERLLMQEGKAEIYRVKRVGNEVEIFFPMGGKQGLRPGLTMTLIDLRGIEVGIINVHEVFEDYSTARVDQSRKVIPGFWVSR
jgi:hypothetical protein